MAENSPLGGKSDLIVYDFDPRNLPSDYLQGVGLIAMASAQTESVMQDFIGALLGIDNIEAIALTTHMGGPLKDRIARALIELNAVSAEVVDEVDDLLDEIDQAMLSRNIIVHSPLIIHPESGEVLSHRLRAKGSLQIELRPISLDEIRDSAARIYQSGMDLMAFMVRYGLGPIERTRPIREPLDRSKKARAERRRAAIT
jgi:hypothetical protein